MRTIIPKKTERFKMKPVQSKIIANDQIDISKKIIEEAKRQAYFDMGLFV